MNHLTTDTVFQLAQSMGLELDESRARTIASRLAGVIDEVNEIPDDLIAAVEPSHTFSAEDSTDGG